MKGLWAVSLACIALLASSCVSQTRYDESEDRSRAAHEEVVRLQGERDAVEERLLALEDAHNRLQARSAVMEEMIDTLRQMGACIRRLQIEIKDPPPAVE